MKLKLALIAAAAILAAASHGALAQSGQLGAGQVSGNPGATAAPAMPSSMTAILDRALGSARGAIIQRGSGGWVIVGPSSTVGLPWVSAGTGADPLYQILGVVGGGTGSGTASGARTNLGLAIGTNVEAWDTDLDCLAALATTGVLHRTGGGLCAAAAVALGADVSGQLPIGNGGTGQATQQAGFEALAPTPTRAGDIIYWNGTHYVTLPGNNSGTQFLAETSSGVPAFGNPVTNVTCGTVSIITIGTCVFPYFSASLSGASQATTSGVTNTIIANSVLADSNSWYNNSTGTFTPQLAGKYLLRGTVLGTGTTVSEVDCYFTRGVTILAQELNLAAGVATSCSITKILSFNGSTDNIVFQGSVTGTGTVTFVGKGAGTFDRTWFEANWIGP